MKFFRLEFKQLWKVRLTWIVGIIILLLSVLYAFAIVKYSANFTYTDQDGKLDNKQFGGIPFSSTVFNGKNNTYISNGKILGGKSGFTDEAGYCLASLAEIKGREYILVTAHAPQDGNNIEDAVKIYNRL